MQRCRRWWRWDARYGGGTRVWVVVDAATTWCSAVGLPFALNGVWSRIWGGIVDDGFGRDTVVGFALALNGRRGWRDVWWV